MWSISLNLHSRGSSVSCLTSMLQLTLLGLTGLKSTLLSTFSENIQFTELMGKKLTLPVQFIFVNNAHKLMNDFWKIMDLQSKTWVAPDTEMAGYPVRPDIRYPARYPAGYPAKYPLKENHVYCWLDFGGYFVMFFTTFWKLS